MLNAVMTTLSRARDTSKHAAGLFHLKPASCTPAIEPRAQEHKDNFSRNQRNGTQQAFRRPPRQDPFWHIIDAKTFKLASQDMFMIVGSRTDKIFNT